MQRQPRTTISRKPLALVVSLCLAVSAVLIPVGAHLPRWIEMELVLIAWWVVWVGVLGWLLWRGHVVEDDAEWTKRSKYRAMEVLPWLAASRDFGCIAFGCGEVGLVILAVALIVAAVFAIVEFVIPGIALLLFLSIGGMLARSVNDTHGCEGRVGKSLFWGVAWATVYIGPLAAIVVWVSSLLKH